MSRQGPTRPRLGFLGVGWIGRHRMKCLLDSGAGDVVALADPSAECLEMAREHAPTAVCVESLDELLSQPLDGVVIATPSALHAAQATAALERGLAVFCQKPLARTAKEAASVVALARSSNLPLGVDLSYRHTQAMQQIRQLVKTGELGHIYAINLVFHNAYGPDKAWFYDPTQAGGGCVVDLGIHLLDLALWLLDYPEVNHVASHLVANGEHMKTATLVEDFASVQLELASGPVVQLACSWRLPAGRDAVIEVSCYGTNGGASMRNVNGSFYDFVAERYRGTSSETLAQPPDAWGGRALVDWAKRVAAKDGFDSSCEHLVDVHAVIDRIYGRTSPTTK